MNRLLLALLALVLLAAACERPAERSTGDEEAPPPAAGQRRGERERPRGVPDRVLKVLRHIDETGEAPEGYVGGRRFLNAERLLPERDAAGRRVTYREWDVNPHRPGVNRGPERLVTGSDDSAYYTADHYRSFKKIR